MAMNACKVTKEATTKCILGWVLTKAFMDKAENINPILEGLFSKQPSVVVVAVTSLSALIYAVGVKVISFKAVLKSLPKIFAHADKGAQSEKKVISLNIQGLTFPLGNGKGTGTPTCETASQRREWQHSNWKEQKEEALDPLLAVLKPAIKIKSDYYDELVKALAGKMSDANILCVIGAANCLICLAKLHVKLSYLAEDIVTFSKHKNPQVKEQTIKFLIGGCSCTCKGGFCRRIRNIDEIGGKSNICAYHSGIDDPQKTKVEEYFEKAVVKYKPPKAKPKAVSALKAKG
ncbi:hypothetical protein BY996DRAFT_6408372 [Phakopsora pachyrhizi]|nr:hypothetical protein BY996DRAFT_6408372 [Phakopsora pachyrhizi]